MSVTLWFMGRPAAGKSTLAKRVEGELRSRDIPIENLDGDEIRQNLHPELGFTKEDRALNNRRTAFICKLLNRNGIGCVVGMITPFRESQREAREIVEPEGTFVLIYVKCSLEEAKRRDPKGLYEQADRGKIENFTGVSHPFQAPHNPDVVVDTEAKDIEENVSKILGHLHEAGVFDDGTSQDYHMDITGPEESEILENLEELGYLK